MYWKIATVAALFGVLAWAKIRVTVQTHKDQDAVDDFWDREEQANFTRKKDLEHLDYIHIPDDLPIDLIKDHTEYEGIKKTIDNLKSERILNLTGLTNTDLKYEYGVANLDTVSKYDENYTAMVTTLQKLADILLSLSHEEEAVKVLEFMVSTNVDIKKTYRLLGQYYLNTFQREKYEALIKKAEALNSINKPYIVQMLRELN